MANLEVRIRTYNEARSMPFAEIPFRQEVIENVLNIIRTIGGQIGEIDVREADLSFQFMDDGERAFLEVVVSDED